MKITACYIVKNEAANLRRSVASIAGAYDELVVVDTGSTDDTVATARQLGARVLQVPWQDDFAAVRNAALDDATGDIILFLDADEYVSAATAPHLRALLERELAGADALLLHMLHIDGEETNILGDTYVLRAMRHVPRLRYVGRIHEELRDGGQDLQRLAVVPDAQLRLYHTGYGASVNRSKAERNLRLLQRELAAAEQRDDRAEQGRLYMYLAEACRGVGDMARAEEYARRDIRQGRRPVVDASRSYHLLLHLLAQDPARQAEREQVAEAAVRDFPELPELHAELAVLRAAHLSFAYPGRAPVFSDLSFTLRRGEHTAIVGASGAGKTTLALLLLGVWPPAHGTLALGGTPYPALPPAAITRAIAALPQGSVLFCHSIRENFRRYRPHASATDIRAALRTACLKDVVRALPGGIDAPLGPDACHLSGGQRCRLLTALALAGDEPVLLLDEPTAGLDAATAARLLDALFAHAKATGRTLLVITHARAFLPRFAQVTSLSPRHRTPAVLSSTCLETYEARGWTVPPRKRVRVAASGCGGCPDGSPRAHGKAVSRRVCCDVWPA